MATISDETRRIIHENAKSKLNGHMIEVAVEEELNKHDMDTQNRLEEIKNDITEAINSASENQVASLDNLTDAINNLVKALPKT